MNKIKNKADLRNRVEIEFWKNDPIENPDSESNREIGTLSER